MIHVDQENTTCDESVLCIVCGQYSRPDLHNHLILWIITKTDQFSEFYVTKHVLPIHWNIFEMFTHWNWIEWENSILFLLWCRNMLQATWSCQHQNWLLFLIFMNIRDRKMTTITGVLKMMISQNLTGWALLEQAWAGPGEMRATKVTVSLCWCPVETETCSPLLRMRHSLRLELSYLTHNCTKQLKYFRDILFKWWSQDVIVFKVKLVIVNSIISQWWWWWWCSNFRKINNDSSVEYLSVSKNSRLGIIFTGKIIAVWWKWFETVEICSPW